MRDDGQVDPVDASDHGSEEEEESSSSSSSSDVESLTPKTRQPKSIQSLAKSTNSGHSKKAVEVLSDSDNNDVPLVRNTSKKRKRTKEGVSTFDISHVRLEDGDSGEDEGDDDDEEKLQRPSASASSSSGTMELKKLPEAKKTKRNVGALQVGKRAAANRRSTSKRARAGTSWITPSSSPSSSESSVGRTKKKRKVKAPARKITNIMDMSGKFNQ